MDYKGIYGGKLNVSDPVFYEGGAHFKYSDLVYVLNGIIKERRKQEKIMALKGKEETVFIDLNQTKSKEKNAEISPKSNRKNIENKENKEKIEKVESKIKAAASRNINISQKLGEFVSENLNKNKKIKHHVTRNRNKGGNNDIFGVKSQLLYIKNTSSALMQKENRDTSTAEYLSKNELRKYESQNSNNKTTHKNKTIKILSNYNLNVQNNNKNNSKHIKRRNNKVLENGDMPSSVKNSELKSKNDTVSKSIFSTNKTNQNKKNYNITLRDEGRFKGKLSPKPTALKINNFLKSLNFKYMKNLNGSMVKSTKRRNNNNSNTNNNNSNNILSNNNNINNININNINQINISPNLISGKNISHSPMPCNKSFQAKIRNNLTKNLKNTLINNQLIMNAKKTIIKKDIILKETDKITVPNNIREGSNGFFKSDFHSVSNLNNVKTGETYLNDNVGTDVNDGNNVDNNNENSNNNSSTINNITQIQNIIVKPNINVSFINNINGPLHQNNCTIELTNKVRKNSDSGLNVMNRREDNSPGLNNLLNYFSINKKSQGVIKVNNNSINNKCSKNTTNTVNNNKPLLKATKKNINFQIRKRNNYIGLNNKAACFTTYGYAGYNNSNYKMKTTKKKIIGEQNLAGNNRLINNRKTNNGTNNNTFKDNTNKSNKINSKKTIDKSNKISGSNNNSKLTKNSNQLLFKNVYSLNNKNSLRKIVSNNSINNFRRSNNNSKNKK